MLEWISKEIASICHKLDCYMFLTQGMRARLKAELSSLLDKRKGYIETVSQLAKEKPDVLKE